MIVSFVAGVGLPVLVGRIRESGFRWPSQEFWRNCYFNFRRSPPGDTGNFFETFLFQFRVCNRLM